MPIIILQHTASEGPGRLGLSLRNAGKLLDVRRLDLPTGGPLNNKHIPTDFDDVDGVISLGGPMMVSDDLWWIPKELDFIKQAHARRLPVVGICLGAQLIAKALGGEVAPMPSPPHPHPGPEWGMLPVKQHPVANTETILAGIPWAQPMFHCHGQEVSALPPGATTLQFSDQCKVQSFRAGLRTYGFQYHFELDLPMIESFLLSGDPQLAQTGLEPKAALAQAVAQYEPYARLSQRLCDNLVSYLFAASRKIVA